MTTTTEKYIKKAVDAAKKELDGANISNCNVTMDFSANAATETLAQALLQQAYANEQNSKAIMELAKTLKPTDACAFKFINNKLEEAQ